MYAIRSYYAAWDISCRNFIFNNTQLGYSYYQQDKVNLIDLNNIQLDVSNMQLGEDSISFRVNNLSFDDNKSFQLNSLKTQFVSRQHVIQLKGLTCETSVSSIGNANITIDQSSLEKGESFTQTGLDLDIRQSKIDFRDIAQILPELKGMDLQVDLSGHLFGTIADLKAKKLTLGFGEKTRLTCDFYINGLPDFENAYISLDLKNSTMDFRDVARVRLPDAAKRKHADIPQFLYDAGLIRYQGNFTGFISDFVAYGSLQSNFGRVNTDLSFTPQDIV